jgi:hypothetical protein
MATDFLRAEITRQFVPMMTAAGFTRSQPKTFHRRRGDLLQTLSFHGSWSGGATFTMCRSVSLLCNPFFQPHTITVGEGHQRANDDDPYVPWQGRTEEEARAAIASAARLARRIALPWFERVCDLPNFVMAYVGNPNTGINDLELAIALARGGEPHRAWWICEHLAPKLPDASDYEQARRDRALDLQSALDGGQAGALLDAWRDGVLEKFKLTGLPDAAA